MTKYREILRLKSLNLSQQNIAHSCNVSKKTVNRVLKRAEELGIAWPLDENDTDAVLAEKFFSNFYFHLCKEQPFDYPFDSHIYPLFQHNFFRTNFDIIHQSNPLHLILPL